MGSAARQKDLHILLSAAMAWATLCLTSHDPVHAQEKQALTVERKGSRAVVTARSGNFRVVAGGVGTLARVQWRDRLQHLKEVVVQLRIRWGHMYDLYSLNEPMLYMRFRTTNVDVQHDGANATILSEGEGEWLGIRIASRVTIDATHDEVQMALKLTRIKGKRQRKFQLQYRVSHGAASLEDIAWVVPAPERFAILRLNDENDQEIYDQASHAEFFKTIRATRRYAILASVPDRQGVFFSGPNLRHVCWGPRGKRLYCFLYGNDAWLKEGEEHTETLSLHPINGLGGVSLDRDDCLAGRGALLDGRYVTDSRQSRVYFTHPDGPATTEASITRDGKTLLTKSGAGDLELDTSELPDGTYPVVKELKSDAGSWRGEEELRILRGTYAAFDETVARIRSFAEGFKPEAAPDANVARIRLGVIDFKLSEVEAYKTLHEVRQVEGLLKDAQRVVAALENDEPATMPKRGELLWAHDLSEETDDFRFFGAGDIEFSPEHGLYFQGVGTINMWTKFAVHGSFMVEFDYCPLESPKGGTMLQICGQHPNPISQYDFMCSASWGSMAYYMFGVRCYHFSFGVRGRVCRLRKTGKGFYILTSIPDPVPELDKWYHLVFVKDQNHLMFFADGKLVQEYFDEGHQGPVLDGGHIGIRNWSTHRSYFRNFRVHRIAPVDDDRAVTRE